MNAGKQKGYQAAETPPELALRAYIGRVRAQQAAEVKTEGSIWSSEDREFRGINGRTGKKYADIKREFERNSAIWRTQGLEQSAASCWTEFGVGTHCPRPKHDKFQSCDDLRWRGRGCVAERKACGTGDPQADVFTADATHQIARTGQA
jgi:hypothetical protein